MAESPMHAHSRPSWRRQQAGDRNSESLLNEHARTPYSALPDSTDGKRTASNYAAHHLPESRPECRIVLTAACKYWGLPSGRGLASHAGRRAGARAYYHRYRPALSSRSPAAGSRQDRGRQLRQSSNRSRGMHAQGHHLPSRKIETPRPISETSESRSQSEPETS